MRPWTLDCGTFIGIEHSNELPTFLGCVQTKGRRAPRCIADHALSDPGMFFIKGLLVPSTCRQLWLMWLSRMRRLAAHGAGCSWGDDVGVERSVASVIGC